MAAGFVLVIQQSQECCLEAPQPHLTAVKALQWLKTSACTVKQWHLKLGSAGNAEPVRFQGLC